MVGSLKERVGVVDGVDRDEWHVSLDPPKEPVE